MKKRFSEAQIIGFLREAEAGLPVNAFLPSAKTGGASEDRVLCPHSDAGPRPSASSVVSRDPVPQCRSVDRVPPDPRAQHLITVDLPGFFTLPASSS